MKYLLINNVEKEVIRNATKEFKNEYLKKVQARHKDLRISEVEDEEEIDIYIEK